ncbi:hypothetical protein Tco_0645423 [Tanacetum coccineum]
MVAILEKTEHNTDFHQIVDFLEASHIKYALMVCPTIYVAHIQQFWSTARVKTVDEATKIIATVNGRQRNLTESSIRRHLKLNDDEGISTLPDTDLFENLLLMGYNILPNQRFSFQKGQFSHQWKFLIHTIMRCLSPKSTSFNEFSSNIVTAIVFLATNRVYNFSKMIFDGMVRNIKSKGKFLMYPRFIEQCLKMSKFGVNKKSAIYDVPFHTPKVFSTLRVNSPSFFGRIVPLFDSMIVTQGKGSENPPEPHHTPSAQDEPTPQHDQTTSQEPQQQETTIPSPSPSDVPIHRRLTKGTIRISQSKVPSPGADETASPSGDDKHGEAFPTATSLDAEQDMENITKTSAMPHEASPRVTSLGGEGSMQQQLTKLMEIVPAEEVYIEALQPSQGDFQHYRPTEDKEKMLWVKLKRLYEPYTRDQLWALQKYMHDPLEWKLYDTCGVHHVSTGRGHEIFMLVEKDYPLTKGLTTVMLCTKLQVDQYSEMANELLIKIYSIANNPI